MQFGVRENPWRYDNLDYDNDNDAVQVAQRRCGSGFSRDGRRGNAAPAFAAAPHRG